MKTKFSVGQIVVFNQVAPGVPGNKPCVATAVIKKVWNSTRILTVLLDARRDPNHALHNVTTDIGFECVKQRLEAVTLGGATAAELQLATVSLGTLAPDTRAAVAAARPTTVQIALMVISLKAAGFDSIQIDPQRRVKDLNGDVPEEVAWPRKRDSKVHTLVKPKDLTKREQGTKFLAQFDLAVDEFEKEESGLLRYRLKLQPAEHLANILKTLHKTFGKPHVMRFLTGCKQYRWNVADTAGVFQLNVFYDLETTETTNIVARLLA